MSQEKKNLLTAISEDTGRALNSSETNLDGHISYEFSRDAYRYCRTLVDLYNEGRYPPSAPDIDVVIEVGTIANRKFHATAPKDAYGRTRLALTDHQKTKYLKLIHKRFGGDYDSLVQISGDGADLRSPLFKEVGNLNFIQSTLNSNIKEHEKLDHENRHSVSKNPVPYIGLALYFSIAAGLFVFDGFSFWGTLGIALIGYLLIRLLSMEKDKKREESLQALNKKISAGRDAYKRSANLVDELRSDQRFGDAWWRSLKGYQLEEELTSMLKAKGCRTTLTQRARDGGIDLETIIGTHTYVIQCKGWTAKVGVAAARELAGVVKSKDVEVRGVLVGTNGFTAEAAMFAAQSGLRLWDAHKLAEIAAIDDLTTTRL
jgi:hypothetical protein